MNERQIGSTQANTKLQGGFFLALGTALLIYMLMPGKFLSWFLVFGGAVVMVLYGAQLLGLHTVLRNLLRKVTKD